VTRIDDQRQGDRHRSDRAEDQHPRAPLRSHCRARADLRRLLFTILNIPRTLSDCATFGEKQQ
jgi:hypothetical protein